MFDCRFYQAHDNPVRNAHDLASDLATRTVLTRMLTAAKAAAVAAGEAVPGPTLEDLIETGIAADMARDRVTRLRGMLHEAEQAVQSYPLEVCGYAADRGLIPIA